MHEVKKETLKNAHKPFDIVTDKNNNVGFIREVSVNDSQINASNQISYAVEWLIGNQNKTAWFDHSELTTHGNILLKIAECACHPMGGNDKWVSKLFGED